MALDPRKLGRLHARYPGRRAVITGAASGLGRALASELARHGWTLLLTDNAADRLGVVSRAAIAAGGIVQHAAFDAADLDAYGDPAATFLDANGGVDLVFTCAGIGVGGSFLDTRPEHFREVIDVNLLGTIWAGKVFLPRWSRPAKAIS